LKALRSVISVKQESIKIQQDLTKYIKPIVADRHPDGLLKLSGLKDDSLTSSPNKVNNYSIIASAEK
jgi:hypothetical protein